MFLNKHSRNTNNRLRRPWTQELCPYMNVIPEPAAQRGGAGLRIAVLDAAEFHTVMDRVRFGGRIPPVCRSMRAIMQLSSHSEIVLCCVDRLHPQDNSEQQRIFKTVEEMALPLEAKGQMLELLGREITIDELVQGAGSLELKSERCLASCLAVELDHPAEFAHLNQLADYPFSRTRLVYLKVASVCPDSPQ